MKIFKKIFIIFFFIFSISFFWYVWEINFLKQKEIKEVFVSKPDFLPTKKVALETSFWFKNLKADYYWLHLIQYIWGNVISSSYKNYLFNMIDIITELNPYYSQPYITWELLLPSYNARYENLTKKEIEKYQNQAMELAQKWIKNFCDLDKIGKIDKEENLQKLFTEEKYKNPCKDGDIAYNLAFIYYFYKKDFKNAVKYYKVASVTDWVPEWAKNLISIFQGRWWDREKSFFMFLNIADFRAWENKVCKDFSNILQQFWQDIFSEKRSLDFEALKEIEQIRSQNIFENESWLSASSCGTFLNKAIRELNIFYLDNADKKYKEKFWKNSSFPKDLEKSWFINYIPKDYQQNKDYWIIYYYNDEIWWYDYKMWTYN